MKIKSISNHEPQYLGAQQFSESDMLLLKESLDRLKKYKNPAHWKAIDELTQKVAEALEIEVPKKDKVKFLENVLRDYIVLTR